MTDKKTKTDIISRPPVIAIVGHIDHGKSTLLDYIRKSNVVETEAGGITQHISAYEVVHQNSDQTERKLTFLDTPGHEAFSSMRKKGTSIADIAILIISAEEGVKPQTLESIEAIKTANIPYVVAINKIDRPNANPEKIKQELAEAGIYVEGYGGDVSFALISAKTGAGISDLLDLLLLTADLEDLKASPKESASGYVLESNHDKQVGTTVTLIIKNGILHQGDFIGISGQIAKIKRLENFLGQIQKSQTVSAPVRIFGLTKAPLSGIPFVSFKTKKEAENYSKNWDLNIVSETEENLGLNLKNDFEIPVVVKSDSQGTLEAVLSEIHKIIDDRVNLKIISSGVGAITDRDLKILSGTKKSIAVGFNVRANQDALDLAERNGTLLQTFDIIYNLTTWLQEELTKQRPNITEEKKIGEAKIIKCFSQIKDKQVIGGRADDGVIKLGAMVKINRRGIVIGQGKIKELQSQKLAVPEVLVGNQFGAMIESKTIISEGDQIEVVEMITT